MRRITLVLLFSIIALAQSSDFQTRLNQGIQAFRNAQYPEAIEAFENAAAINPTDVNPLLYLGTTWLTMYIPGSSSPENLANAHNAESAFTRALNLDSANKVALASLASLSYQQVASLDSAEKLQKLDESAGWYEKLAAIDPRDKQAHYSLGVIAWAKVYPARMQARANAGMRPETPGPLSDINRRQSLKASNGSIIEQGMRELETALRLDPNYDDAMAYLNLLYRERADLSDTPEEYQRDSATADEWVRQALETKKLKAQTSSAFSRLAPPPPPPPPPPSGGVDASGLLSGERTIRVGATVQAANLIAKVDPIYPPLAKQARIQGTVRFNATIGVDGHIENLQLFSGHPLLVTAAEKAAKEWVYKPVWLNGNPVRVVTQIDVNFTLPMVN